MAKADRDAIQFDDDEKHRLHLVWSRSGKHLIVTASTDQWEDLRQVELIPDQGRAPDRVPDRHARPSTYRPLRKPPVARLGPATRTLSERDARQVAGPRFLCVSWRWLLRDRCRRERPPGQPTGSAAKERRAAETALSPEL